MKKRLPEYHLLQTCTNTDSEQYFLHFSGSQGQLVPYRFSFNGKEKDDEVYGAGNQYDYGARMYDARLGRWWSVDENASSYAHLSPYLSFANNPIMFVDPNGKDNVIYLVARPEAIEKMGIVQINAMIDGANKTLMDLGLDTRVVLFDENMSGGLPINTKYVDENDAIVVLGEVNDIKQYVQENVTGEIGATSNNGWQGGAENNPEQTYAPRSVVMLDVNAVVEDASSFKSTPSEFGGLLMLHGTGHVAGDYDYGVTNDKASGGLGNVGIMTSGDWTKHLTTYGNKKINDFMKNTPLNKTTYVNKMKEKFQYGENKRTSQSNYETKRKYKP